MVFNIKSQFRVPHGVLICVLFFVPKNVCERLDIVADVHGLFCLCPNQKRTDSN